MVPEIILGTGVMDCLVNLFCTLHYSVLTVVNDSIL